MPGSTTQSSKPHEQTGNHLLTHSDVDTSVGVSTNVANPASMMVRPRLLLDRTDCSPAGCGTTGVTGAGTSGAGVSVSVTPTGTGEYRFYLALETSVGGAWRVTDQLGGFSFSFGVTAGPGVNVALATRGATTGDNGHFEDGIHTPAPSAWAIDGNPTTYWSGWAHTVPQMMWVNFDATYRINRVVIRELPQAYINSGRLEYSVDGSDWQLIAAFDKSAANHDVDFAPVNASAVRLSVYSSTAPSSWYNRVACITALEVYTAP